MADVFISYKREERDIAEYLARALTTQGYSVWWDIDLLPGDRFASEIEAVIKRAKAVIVLWSERSRESEWVLEEASEANKRGILIPVAIDNVEPPFGFTRLHTFDLIDWDGDPGSVELTALLDAVQGKLAAASGSHDPPPTVSDPLGAFRVEAEYWRSVASADPPRAGEYQGYLRKFGDNAQFADLARTRISEPENKRHFAFLDNVYKRTVATVALLASIVGLILGVQQLLDVNHKPDLAGPGGGTDDPASVNGADVSVEVVSGFPM